MNILVTGGTGFIGSNLIEKLSGNGNKIICVSKDFLNTTDLKDLNIDLIRDDLNNGIAWESILRDTEIVYHIAGITRARNSRDYYEGNHEATRNLMKACSKYCKKLKRFVYLSSLSAVGPALDEFPVNEDTHYHPVSDYGKSKMLAELEVLKYSAQFPITILRPSAVYGPRERDMYMYMKSIKKGVQLLIGKNRKYLNLIYIDDLIDGIIAASTNEAAENQVYFLGSPESYPNEVIGETIAGILHRKIINFHLPDYMVYIVCLLQEIIGKVSGKNMFLNREKAKELVQSNWTCSIEKAKKDFGFDPHISLNEGFSRTYEWYLKMGWM
jgi:dihydroflavonol-4-reductase